MCKGVIFMTRVKTLMKEERSRPINEQFPLLCLDMDTLTANTVSLTESTKRLCRTEENKGKEMEAAVLPLFSDWLQENQWDSTHVPIKDGKISSLEDKKTVLVQWDGIICAERGDEKMLYLIETKQIADVNDILKPSDGLYDRGVKTRQYLLDLMKGFKKGMNYNLENKIQHSILRLYFDYSITVVYASGLMKGAVKEELIKAESLYQQNSIPISVLKMECPRLTKCEIASPSVRNQITFSNNL